MTVLMRRAENSAETFSAMWVWLDGGFAQTPRMTILAGHDGSGWRSAVVDGVVYATERSSDIDVTPALTVLQSLWKDATHSAYVDRAAEPTVRPTVMPEALGLKVHDRTIESVFTDTVFPPRLTLGPNQ